MDQISDQLQLFSEKTNQPEIGENFVCLDIECTGFNHEDDDIIEVAAVKFTKTKQGETFHTLIATKKEIPIIIQDLTGIKNSMLTDAPTLDAISKDLIDFVGDLPIVGHNINFDLDFLEAKGINFPGRRIDTFPLSQMVINDQKSYSLETLAHYFSKHQPSHRALDDVLANIELFWHILELWQQKHTPLTKSIIEKSDLQYKKLLLDYPTNPITKAIKEADISQNKTGGSILVTNNKSIKELLTNNLNYIEIIPHQQEIDSQKWTQFLKQKNYTEAEATLAIKIALKSTTQTLPRTTKLALYGGEYSELNKLTKTKAKIDLSSNLNYLVSHRYFFQELEAFQNQEIEFVNDPFLQELFIRARSKYIRFSELPEETTITFGRLGIFYEKHALKQESPYLLSDDQVNSKEFQDILQSFTPFIEHIPSSANHYIWLETRSNTPPQIGYLTKNTSYDLSELSRKHNIKLNIQKSEKTKGMPLSVLMRLGEPNSFNYKQEITDQLEIIINEQDRDICILATSYEHIKHIFKYCLKKYPHRNVISQQYSGSAGKISHKLETATDHNLLICTYQFYLKHKPKLPHLDRLFLTKLPINTPNHPFYVIQEQNNKQFFMEYVIPHAAANLYHTLAVNSVCRNNYLFDKRLYSKSYGQKIIDICQEQVEFLAVE